MVKGIWLLVFRFLCICVILNSWSSRSLAQIRFSVKGIVKESVSHINMENSVVLIINATDSMITNFSRVDANGLFNITGIDSGKYIIQVTYPDYIIYSDHFSSDATKSGLDFGQINLTRKSLLLNEVVIKSNRSLIKLKGDTTEYDAGGFSVQENAKVEDLLKQLPGMQVDRNGKITAQGQTVNKVLVDGEEFFGDDPTLVTKNVRADMVDKIQLYDKKSDQNTLTGVDDGKGKKTINIILKEDKRSGYFGKIDAGGGTNQRYDGQAMFNLFNNNTKLAVYGTYASTGRIGLGWEDNSTYGDLDMGFDSGLITISGSNDEFDSFDGRYNGVGSPKGKTAGIHYSTKWNKDKEYINANYKVGSMTVTGTKGVLTQNNLPLGLISTADNQEFNNYASRQKISTVYQNNLDELSNLKITIDGTFKDTQTLNNFNSTSHRSNGNALNEGARNLENRDNIRNLHAGLLWSKKFKRAGRSLSANIEGVYMQNNSKGTLNSRLTYFNPLGFLDSIQYVDQYKTNSITNSAVTSSIVYSDKVSNSLSVIVGYGIGASANKADKISYNRSAQGSYSILDSTLSNKYTLDQFSQNGSLIFNYKTKTTLLNVGSKVAFVIYHQIDGYSKDTKRRDFTNWNPLLNFTYKPDQGKSIRLNYNGNTVQPNLQQLQPIMINNDPLNIIIGNPSLRPSFNNKIDITYQSYSAASGTSFSMYGSYNLMLNPIVNNILTDSAGKSTFQAVNFAHKGIQGFNLAVTLGKKFAKSNLQFSTNVFANGFIIYNSVNGLVNKTTANDYGLQLKLSRAVQKDIDFNLAFGPKYLVGRSSLQAKNNNGYGFNGTAGTNIFLPVNLQTVLDADYQYNGKTESFNQGFERLTVNIKLIKSLLKEKGLKVTCAVYDLLNQNKGFSRMANGGVLMQTTFTNIRRYGLLSLSWDFSKMGVNNQSKN